MKEKGMVSRCRNHKYKLERGHGKLPKNESCGRSSFMSVSSHFALYSSHGLP